MTDNLRVGWQGSGGLSVTTTIINIWFGGMLFILSGVGEFLLGNNFTMMVFLAYGAHFLSYATTFIPYYNAIGFFNPDGSSLGSPGTGNQTPMFMASYGKCDDSLRSIKVRVLITICHSVLPSCDVHTLLYLLTRLLSDEWRLRGYPALRYHWVRSRCRHLLPACSREHHIGNQTSQACKQINQIKLDLQFDLI